MTTLSQTKLTPDIPTQIFEKFIQALETTNVPDEMKARLRKTLLEERNFTETAIKAAILGAEPLP